MWVCTTHMKETLLFLETPHVSKASFQIKCSLCNNLATAKVYYTHRTYHFTKKQFMDSLSKSPSKKSG
ncbi:hypothetical protein CN326_15205 [Bacillus sp. AFS018417]|nr:hypothetical protein CN326_15205 [Bacillus sp. AFS018417]